MWLVTTVLWAVAMLVTLQSTSSSDRFVNLSNKNLSSVPKDLPHTVEHLDLSCNHIKQLQREDFKNTTQLRFLNMSLNLLETIDPETFFNNLLLEKLDLSHNKLTKLEHQQYLRHTENLLVLHLDHNNFMNMTLGNEFSILKKIQRLSLEAKVISRGDFKQISKHNLATLSLSVDNTFYYEAGSLQDVCAKKLQISFLPHQKTHHDLVSDALSRFDKVELSGLRQNSYDELIAVLREHKQINTSDFYLSNIGIHWIDLTQFVNAALQTSILHIICNDVELYKLPYNDTPVAKTSNMKSFTTKGAEVKEFFFSQNAVYSFFINMPVQTLAIVETSMIHMTCPESPSPIQHLNFSYCAMSDTIFYRVDDQQIIECKNLGNVKRLTMVNNNLKSFQTLSKRVQYMNSLKYVDASLNSLVYDGLEECLWPTNITNMILAFNSLSSNVFKCLPKGIRILDLQNNEVSVVPSIIMKLQNLLSLNLNGNRLRDLPVCTDFPILNTLLLKSNSLHAPSVSNLETCPQIRTLDISHNPFTCICSLCKFRNLAITSERNTTIKLISWPFGYYCLYPEELRNTTLREASISEIYCNSALLAATILCPAVFTIVAIVSVCHYLDVPWYMGMVWQWTRAKHRARRQNISSEDMAGVRFHAFISFSQHNAEWVHSSMLANLSELRICHHEKHFLPGRTIIENIMSCVQKSRRSVFVLSAHFVKSEWCHYELYFATHQRLVRGPDSVVLVLLEPVPQYLIPSKYHQLKSIMRRHTYLEWPQDKTKQRLFWANLRAALQADIPSAPATELEE